MNPFQRKSYFSAKVVARFTVSLLFIFLCLSPPIFSATHEASTGNNNAESIIATMDDTQVRAMLLDELKKDLQKDTSVATNEKPITGFGNRIARLLGQMENESDSIEQRIVKMLAYFPNIFPDLIKVHIQMGSENSLLSFFKTFASILIVLLICYGLEYFVEKRLTNNHFAIDTTHLPAMGGPAKIISGFTNLLPGFIGLIIFAIFAYTLFCIFFDAENEGPRLLFLTLLIFIVILRLISMISQLIFSPHVPEFRVMDISCAAAKAINKYFTLFFTYVLGVTLFTIYIRTLGADERTVNAIQVILATSLVVFSIFAVLAFKTTVKNYLLESNKDSGKLSWAFKTFASSWHILASLYFFVIWVLLIHDLTQPNATPGKGAFIISFFVIPIWIIMNSLGQWVAKTTLSSLHLHTTEYDDSGKEIPEEEIKRREDGHRLYVKVSNITKIMVTFGVGMWFADLWNFRIPFISNLTSVFFDTLIILTIALLFWQIISGWIERKIKASIPEEKEDEDSDSEWGGAATRGRSYTLLPMIRKFIGSVLICMVTLTILSSMGVDIGPLLAGAGVMGLAIGFGAQKLVSDVFSGFFYLLDDAFRVGEYMEAGGISGTVESISLRNVMLRHHRGMLQIVPHSDLGAITNFMRGGIIVKFNLDFPYDADIEQIRKVIKKVGQAMMKEEEFSKDFIQPIKSAGVREIANSVMTIRVKFTAQPGTHFVIRREAYRRLTDALAAKGIHYAHRKVIVDIPQPATQEQPSNQQTPATTDAVKQAAGAAAMAALQHEEEQKAVAQGPAKSSPML